MAICEECSNYVIFLNLQQKYLGVLPVMDKCEEQCDRPKPLLHTNTDIPHLFFEDSLIRGGDFGTLKRANNLGTYRVWRVTLCNIRLTVGPSHVLCNFGEQATIFQHAGIMAASQHRTKRAPDNANGVITF